MAAKWKSKYSNSAYSAKQIKKEPENHLKEPKNLNEITLLKDRAG